MTIDNKKSSNAARKSSNAAKLQSLAFPVDYPGAEPAYQSYCQGQNGGRIIRKKRVVKGDTEQGHSGSQL